MRRGRHLLRHSSTGQNVIGLSSAESEYYTQKRGCSGLGLQSLFCRLAPDATTLIAHRLFEREGSFIAQRSWQEHSSHTDEDAVATGTCSSTTRASCESSNGIKSCRHTDESTWEIENGGMVCRTWSDRASCENGEQQNPRKVKKLKTVKIAVETMETNVETIKNKLKDSRSATIKKKLKDSRVACKITMDAHFGLNSEVVKSGEWTSCGARKHHSTFRCGRGWNFAVRVKNQNHERMEWRLLRHWWCGVFLDSAISPPIPTSCSSHTEACNALRATDGITSLTTTCTLTVTTGTLLPFVDVRLVLLSLC